MPKEPKNILKILEDLLHIVKYRFGRRSNVWYITGEKTSSSSAKGVYADVENIVTTLEGPATAGFVQNTSTSGNIFIAFSRNGVDFTTNEIKILAGSSFRWGEEPTLYEVRYIHVRSDAQGTKYQVFAL